MDEEEDVSSKRYLEKEIAKERIEKLVLLAVTTYKEDPELAKRYIELALRIAKKAKVRIPREYKLMFCKKCCTPLIPGLTARVRLRQNRFPHLSITCLNCKRIKRIPLHLKETRD